MTKLLTTGREKNLDREIVFGQRLVRRSDSRKPASAVSYFESAINRLPGMIRWDTRLKV
jgi:hypothetical protein